MSLGTKGQQEDGAATHDQEERSGDSEERWAGAVANTPQMFEGANPQGLYSSHKSLRCSFFLSVICQPWLILNANLQEEKTEDTGKQHRVPTFQAETGTFTMRPWQVKLDCFAEKGVLQMIISRQNCV